MYVGSAESVALFEWIHTHCSQPLATVRAKTKNKAGSTCEDPPPPGGGDNPDDPTQQTLCLFFLSHVPGDPDKEDDTFNRDWLHHSKAETTKKGNSEAVS